MNILSTTTHAVALVLLAAMATMPANAQETTSTKTAAAQRIVSLNGSNTELLFALGLGAQVVGRDDSSIYPEVASKIPSVGYQYKLSAEGILSLNPTLIVGRDDVKPPTVIEQINGSGIDVELLSEPSNLEQARKRIIKLGSIVGREAKADQLAKSLDEDIKKFEARKEQIGAAAKMKAVFIYMRGPHTTFVLGKDTGPGHMLELVGATNAIPEVTNTMPVTAESLIAARPEVIVAFSGGVESVGGIDGLLKLPGIALTPAGKNRRIVIMDDLYMAGFTNRAGKAALDLLNAIAGDGVTVVKGR